MDPKLAIGAGVAAVGVGVALLWSKITGAATPPPVVAPAGGAPYPVGDAATFTRAPAPVTVSFTAIGQTLTRTWTPDPTQVAGDVSQATTLAKIGHGEGKEGTIWSRKAVVDGASAAQVAQLRALGYGV